MGRTSTVFLCSNCNGPVWVRLDRRRSTKVSVLGLLCAAGSTTANDTVSSMHRLCFIYALLNNNSTTSATCSQKGRLHCVRAGSRSPPPQHLESSAIPRRRSGKSFSDIDYGLRVRRRCTIYHWRQRSKLLVFLSPSYKNTYGRVAAASLCTAFYLVQTWHKIFAGQLRRGFNCFITSLTNDGTNCMLSVTITRSQIFSAARESFGITCEGAGE